MSTPSIETLVYRFSVEQLRAENRSEFLRTLVIIVPSGGVLLAAGLAIGW